MNNLRLAAGLRTCSAIVAVGALTLVGAGPAGSEPSLNAYGVPGLVDMPTARVMSDGQLSATFAYAAKTRRSSLSFQITPRLSGTFRYSGIEDYNHPDSVDGVFYDRSFDLKFQLVREGQLVPAIAIGLQDFAGTGLFGAEYIVATKEIVPGLDVTAGVGWGRLGSYNSFASAGTRNTAIAGRGGSPSTDQWFRGDMAAFGGISYALNERLRFNLEYSSDAYTNETANAGFNRESPWNFGLDYTTKNGTQLSFYHAYGTTWGAQATFYLNPKKSPAPGGIAPAPQPVAVRTAAQRADLGWTRVDGVETAIAQDMRKTLLSEGILLQGIDVTGTSATVRIENLRYRAAAQALGRTARTLSRGLPGSIETLTIVPTENGVGMSAVTFSRSDIEALEHRSASEILSRMQLADAHGRTPGLDGSVYPRFQWSLNPTAIYSTFDPDAPIRADLRLNLAADYEITPNLVLSGEVSQKLAGNIDTSTRTSNSVLPHVRSDIAEYERNNSTTLDHLTLAYFGRPGKNLYGRVTLGYLERMYAGLSTELLWKPVDSRLALGVEVNYVQQRDFDQGFGLRDYDIVTGHASAYYDFGNGFLGQLDVGRYLAGDYGATISLDREFGNGWKVGAYATFTDVSADDFGEGSFDKGIRLTVPLEALTGRATRRAPKFTISPLTRDGGARLNVQDRLYETVRTNHRQELVESWGKFWR